MISRGILLCALILPGAANAALTYSTLGVRLTITSDGDSDTIAVSVNGDRYFVNGADPAEGPFLTADYFQIFVEGGGGEDVLDASALTTGLGLSDSLFVNLNGGEDNDTLIGSPDYSTTLEGGPGVDSITGGAAGDTIAWRAGDGLDTPMDAGGGNDNLSVFLSDTVTSIRLVEEAGSVRIETAPGAADGPLITSVEDLSITDSSMDDQIQVGTLHNLGITRAIIRTNAGMNIIDASGFEGETLVFHDWDESDLEFTGAKIGIRTVQAATSDAPQTITVSGAGDFVQAETQNSRFVNVRDVGALIMRLGSGDDTVTVDQLPEGGASQLSVFCDEGDDTIVTRFQPYVRQDIRGEEQAIEDVLIVSPLGIPYTDTGSQLEFDAGRDIVYSGFETLTLLDDQPPGDVWSLKQ